MARQSRRFVPRLDAFDDRIVPTVQVLPLTPDGTLTILGGWRAGSGSSTMERLGRDRSEHSGPPLP
ncbi:MAG TPA: hypothetical protein VKD90_00200, partial [Gemmataceae bacterium]|nr:hypothetical protein [Gemmataceae bacterium]